MRDVAESHKDQAEAFLAEAEQGDALAGVVGQLQAAQTHALLACYFELRYQSEVAFPGRG